MADSNELAGKVAIVTGAGRNIGRAIARQLAAAGASVVVNARSNQAEADAVVREIEAAGGNAMAVLADVGDAAAVEAMAQAALKRFGRIDILVNNAALRREKPIDQMSYADWREVMNATLDSAFHGGNRQSGWPPATGRNRWPRRRGPPPVLRAAPRPWPARLSPCPPSPAPPRSANRSPDRPGRGRQASGKWRRPCPTVRRSRLSAPRSRAAAPAAAPSRDPGLCAPPGGPSRCNPAPDSGTR